MLAAPSSCAWLTGWNVEGTGADVVVAAFFTSSAPCEAGDASAATSNGTKTAKYRGDVGMSVSSASYCLRIARTGIRRSSTPETAWTGTIAQPLSNNKSLKIKSIDCFVGTVGCAKSGRSVTPFLAPWGRLY
ncbi:hypothetical protein BN2476_560092 [Paraburkholderia piptadeniae]|uniref:Uncharacterized protein n=1 Tax=Paraburkholderia piptadeniae TaxID=1701573 RepID=A0A1N7SIT0_9BURK|nr:hypothetical protein BN2476_560092 [Paraburkholderia piptadeniae]